MLTVEKLPAVSALPSQIPVVTYFGRAHAISFHVESSLHLSRKLFSHGLCPLYAPLLEESTWGMTYPLLPPLHSRATTPPPPSTIITFRTGFFFILSIEFILTIFSFQLFIIGLNSLFQKGPIAGMFVVVMGTQPF